MREAVERDRAEVVDALCTDLGLATNIDILRRAIDLGSWQAAKRVVAHLPEEKRPARMLTAAYGHFPAGTSFNGLGPRGGLRDRTSGDRRSSGVESKQGTDRSAKLKLLWANSESTFHDPSWQQ